MKIRTKKCDNLFHVMRWPSVGVPVGDAWDKARQQVVRAIDKIGRNGQQGSYNLVHIAFDREFDCYNVRESYPLKRLTYFDGRVGHYGEYAVDADEVLRIIDDGGYWAIVGDRENLKPLVDFINKREGIYCGAN